MKLRFNNLFYPEVVIWSNQRTKIVLLHSYLTNLFDVVYIANWNKLDVCRHIFTQVYYGFTYLVRTLSKENVALTNT